MYNASWCRRTFPLERGAALRLAVGADDGARRWACQLVTWMGCTQRSCENLCLLTFLLNHGCSIAFRLYATLILFLPSAFHPKFHGRK